jgi:hypothetical protein
MFAQLRGTQGGRIPAGAGADHDYVVRVAHAENQSTVVIRTGDARASSPA